MMIKEFNSDVSKIIGRNQDIAYQMAEMVLDKLNSNKEKLKILSKYANYLVDSAGHQIEISPGSIGLFRTKKFADKGNTDGLVYLDLFTGEIKIDIQERLPEQSEPELDIAMPYIPRKLTKSMLADCLPDGNNFTNTIQAVDAEYLVDCLKRRASKLEETINLLQANKDENNG